MTKNTLILLWEYSAKLGVDTSFILTLEEHGLIRTVTVEQQIYVELAQLPRLEKFTRLSEDLGINIAGIEAINNLLDRIENLQHELLSLENKLRIYE